MIPGTLSQLNDSLSFVEGDTWGGIPEISITISGTPPADDVASAKMQFHPASGFETVATITSAGGGITITSAANWTFIVPAQDLELPDGSPLPSGSYVWGFQTTDINGVKQTYLEGTVEVLPAVVEHS